MSLERLEFNFITDEDFRTSLESDFEEMHTCAASGAWKAVHVLAGSIVEAVLVAYLLGAGTKPDPLRMSLTQLIEACKKEGVLSDRTADLSAALKSYRNLIHPGRALRLGENADADGASVAQSLVAIIVKEIAAKQQQEYGFTAEQLLTKFESDPSALGISEHLLKEAKNQELERLLLKVLPAGYFEECQREYSNIEILRAHTRLFRVAFEAAPEATRKRVMRHYVSVLKEEGGPKVQAYEEEFFRAPDLAYLKPSERALVKAHLFARLKTAVTPRLITVTRGIGSFLTEEDVTAFVDPFARTATIDRDPDLQASARDLLTREAVSTPSKVDPLISSRLGDWVAFYEEKDMQEQAEVVVSIKTAYDLFEDIPF